MYLISNKRVGHRAWNWFDEQGGSGTFVLPRGKPTKQTPGGNTYILPFGGVGDNDQDEAQMCSVVYDRRIKKLYGFYRGVKGATSVGMSCYTTDLTFASGLTKVETFIYVVPASWRSIWASFPFVILDEVVNQFKCWYTGYNGTNYNCGYMTCDGDDDPTVAANWSQYGSNPLSGLTNFKIGMSVVRIGDIYVGTFQNTSNIMQLAKSDDGIAWTTIGTLVPLGASGEWDDSRTLYCTLKEIKGVIYAFYSGRKVSDGKIRIGIIGTTVDSMLDPSSWKKAEENYIIDVEPSEPYEDGQAIMPIPFFHGRDMWLIYSTRGASNPYKRLQGRVAKWQ